MQNCNGELQVKGILLKKMLQEIHSKKGLHFSLQLFSTIFIFINIIYELKCLILQNINQLALIKHEFLMTRRYQFFTVFWLVQ